MKAEELIGSKITIRGKIERVTFKEPNYSDGGFAIIKVDCQELIKGDIPEDFALVDGTVTLLTFRGLTPSLSMKATYDFVGELVFNDRYGYQYNIIRMSEYLPLITSEDQRKFFEYILTPRLADALMEKFENPLYLLEAQDIKSLCSVPGIGIATANKIIEKYNDTKIDREAYVKFYDYGLTANLIKKLCDQYGSAEVLIKKIEENPYLLIYDVKGIGWTKADNIANLSGIKKDDPRRIKAYIFFLLNSIATESGDTYALLDELIEPIKIECAGVPDDNIRMALLDLIKENRLIFDKKTRRIGLTEYYNLEDKIAKELYRIYTANKRVILGVEQSIEECEKYTGFNYSKEQREAVYNCIRNNVSIVTGLAGCGKSSVMYPVVRVMRNNNLYVAQCALSGKAALNLTEITGIEGKTIHRLLGYDEFSGFVHNETNPLGYDMIILDEASMVDEYIFYALLKAIPNGCKLILVGDTGQLEPIGIGCAFNDIINSQEIPHVHFTKIFRQAQKSGIITESRKVYNKEQIVKRGKYTTETRGELQDFKIVTVSDASDFVPNIVREYKRFQTEFNATVDDIIIVVGKRSAGETSARAINNVIQHIVNPEETMYDVSVNKKDGTTSYSVTFRPGDKVLVTKNCYDTTDLQGNRTPVFNGNIGTIISIDNMGMTVKFLQGTIWYPKSKYVDLELGYAITCHKLQGSGFPYVITVCDTGSYVLLSKEWLYTAITRSQKQNTLIGQPNAICKACSTTNIQTKRTWLKEFLVSVFEGGI